MRNSKEYFEYNFIENAYISFIYFYFKFIYKIKLIINISSRVARIENLVHILL